jgi:hypothetical protein
MSTPGILFSIYFFIGLLLMVVAVASRGKEKRTKDFAMFGSGGAPDAVLLLFIALLWPVWILALLGRKDQTHD